MNTESPEYTMSESIENLQQALHDFQTNLVNPTFNQDNDYFNSQYLDLAGLWHVMRPMLAKYKLTLLQIPHGSGTVTTRLMHESGEFIQSTLTLTPQKQTPQAYGSAITYTRRYMMTTMLGIVAEKDDDGNLASQKPLGKKLPPKKGPDDSTDSQKPPGQKPTENEWLNTFGAEHKKRVKELANSCELREIISKIRSQYKVSKKMEFEITDYYNDLLNQAVDEK